MDSNSQRRIYQYVDIDGTRELMLGTGYFFIGLIPVVVRFPINTEFFLTVLPFFILLLFLGGLWFKQRVTYPRTGQAISRRPSSFTIGLFVLSLVSMLFQHRLPKDVYLTGAGYPLLFGASLAVVLLLAGQGLRRFYLYAAVALTTGFGSVVAGLDSDAGMFLTAFFTGLALIISGGRVLRRYLAEHAPPGGA